MSLKIFHSSRLEALAEHLKETLKRERSAEGFDPFHFSEVVVSGPNVAKWLQLRVFARESALCAGIRFPFFEGRLEQLMREGRSRAELLEPGSYRNAILSMILDPDADAAEAMTPFRQYVFGADDVPVGPLPIDTRRRALMAWQLATKLADLMDSYEVHRPDIIVNWLEGGSARGGKTQPVTGSAEAGEAAIARKFWGTDGLFAADKGKLSLGKYFEEVKKNPPPGERNTLYFFGPSMLTPLQVDILGWLASKHDVLVYLVCPSRSREANPLLKSLGKASDDTLKQLAEFEKDNAGNSDSAQVSLEWINLDADTPASDSVLGGLQKSLREDSLPTARQKQDASIQIVGTPGLRREVELVYNSILGSVWMSDAARARGEKRPWSECTFSDIAVLVPDMATYRPMIEAVFGARGEVPYGLLDGTAAAESPYLAGFEALVELGRTGLTRGTLFAVLENTCVQNALGFDADDVSDWKEITPELGAFNGFEARDSEDRFNWDWALSRLRLGMVANTLKMPDGTTDIPLVKSAGTRRLKFSEVVERVFLEVRRTFFEPDGTRSLLPCAGEKGMDTWAFRLRRMADALLSVPDDDALEEAVRVAVVESLEALNWVKGPQGFELVVAAVNGEAGSLSCRKGRFLTDGVTIGAMKPMRAIPFKQIYVLGLGAGGFPGRTHASTLDVRETGECRGDVSAPDVNRELLLETLMAARERLVITYPNLDLEKDAQLFPSAIVRELEKFLGKNLLTEPFKEYEKYPLLERGEADSADKDPTAPFVWRPDDCFAGILPSYSRVAHTLALRRRKPAKVLEESAKSPSGGDAASETTPSVRHLAAFLKSPFNAVMRYQLGLQATEYVTSELPEDCPLEIEGGPGEWNLLQRWFEDPENGLRTALADLRLRGGLPNDYLGDYSETKFREKVMSEENRARLERLVAAVRRFEEESSDRDVRTFMFFTGKSTNSCVPHVGLDALLQFLVEQGEDGRGKRTFRWAAVNLEDGTGTVWSWCDVTPKAARKYIQDLAADYRTYLQSTDGLIDFDYKKLAKALPAELKEDATAEVEDWDAFTENLLKEGYNEYRSSYNKELVVDGLAGQFARPPTAEEFERIFERRYRLPLRATFASMLPEEDSEGGEE